MNYKLSNTHLFIEPFEQEFPKLTIITGINGSGKTKLLEAISEGIVKTTIPKTDITFVNNNTFAESNVGNNESPHFDLMGLVYDYHVYLDPTHINRRSGNKQNDELWFLLKRKEINIFSTIAKRAKKDIKNLVKSDFETYLPLGYGGSDESLFYKKFYQIFLTYCKKINENDLAEFKNSKHGTNEKSYNKEEFLEVFGIAPWNFANALLEEASIKYRFDSPLDSMQDGVVKVVLRNIDTNNQVSFQQLSSGEKVVLSLIFAIYNIDSGVNFPKLILFDEPDASLHPAMIKQFFKIIKNVFIEKYDINIIITTHSPTTVALADNAGIYAMTPYKGNIEEISKDHALKILTEGVPSFSVNYENRRQIFVESNNDVKYYDKFYTVLKNKLQEDISLYFVSSGVGPNDKNGMPISNCDQVKKVTSILRDNGNNFVWGIVDWDLNGDGVDCEFVKILGKHKRYSIENYIFDPIAIAAFLLKRELISKEELNLFEHETYLDFKTFNNEKLQNICDTIIKKIEPFRDNAEKLAKHYAEDKVAENVLLNGKIYNIPLWVNELRGHYLEDEVYLKAFPELEKIKNKREEKLKLFVLNEIYCEIPEIIPYDILELFIDLQKI